MSRKIFYLTKLSENCISVPDYSSSVSYTLPHQAVSPVEILENWVTNDDETMVHTPTDDWNKGDVHPNSIREFEDEFEAMEYMAALTGEPVTLDVDNLPSAADTDSSSSDDSSGDSSSSD